ncbi:MAG: glycosyltransferase [Flavobacteriales bacterium]
MITILSPYYSPANKAGGPIKSIEGIAEILQNNSFDYTIITRDKDIDHSPLEKTLYKKGVHYQNKISISLLNPFFRKSDIIWINSLYSFSFSILPILALLMMNKKTLLISPRGQLLQGSVTNKKLLYLKLLKWLLKKTKHQVVIHYTNKEEQNKSLPIFKDFKNIIFNNPLSGKIDEYEIHKKSTKFNIGFFGRVSPIKNIEFIIKLFSNLPKSFSFQIYGSIEDKVYYKKLIDLIKKLNLENQISFEGNYDKANFSNKVKRVDLIVIPSFSENFCHVFFEAIEKRKMVLASNGLPWESVNLLVKNTILPLDKYLWLQQIKYIASLNEEQYKTQQIKLLQYYQTIYNTVKNDVIISFKKLLNNNGIKK